MNGDFKWLPAVLFLGLTAFGFSGLLIYSEYNRNKKRLERMREVAKPFHRKNAEGVQAFLPESLSNQSIKILVTSLFGLSPELGRPLPQNWWVIIGGCLVLTAIPLTLISRFFGDLILLFIPVVWIFICRAFFGWRMKRHQDLLLQQFPDALGMIVRSIRVGVTVHGAITAVGRKAQSPTSDEFTRLAHALSVGVALDKAVADLAVRNDLAEFRFFATTIALQAQTGGGLSNTLESLADLIRKRRAVRERGHALSSEARTSSMVLGLMPIIAGGGLSLLNPAYMSVLFTTSTGRNVLLIAAGSLLCGILMMRTIIKRTLS